MVHALDAHGIARAARKIESQIPRPGRFLEAPTQRLQDGVRRNPADDTGTGDGGIVGNGTDSLLSSNNLGHDFFANRDKAAWAAGWPASCSNWTALWRSRAARSPTLLKNRLAEATA